MATVARDAPTDEATRHRQWPRLSGPMAPVLACLACCFGIMPIVYGLVAFHGRMTPLAKPEVIQHLIFNCVANAAVMAGALKTSGRLDQRLTEVLRRALLAHGALAFLTLITRHFYSIPMMLVGVGASAALGMAAVMLGGGSARPRIGVLGPWHWVVDDPELNCGFIDPSAPDMGKFDLVLITLDGEIPADWAPLVSRALLAGRRVRHIAEFLEEDRGTVALAHFEINDIEEDRLTRYRMRKRLLDLFCVAVLAPLALPVTALAALGILFTMGRPILFIQSRVGLGGHAFQMLKLRTMRPPTTLGLVAATVPDDRRITPFGRWLRRFRVDELPQLWNVLKGDMSFIGPRPEWTALAERFTQQERTYAFRHVVRPGITGWAQVNAGPAADIAETRVKLGYDLFYIKNLSFGLDIQILARTVWTLIAGGGVR